MVQENYFELMKQTSKKTDKILLPYIEGVIDEAKVLPKSRIGKPRLRDVIIRLGYEITGGRNSELIAPLCASYELLNCSTYVVNWIFDEKGGPKSKSETDNLIIGGFQLRELSQRVLRENNLEELTESLSLINDAVYSGQNLDLNVLTLNKIEDFKTYKDFIRHYELRCGNLSGEFYGKCLFGGSVISRKENKQLYEIGKMLGIGGQASNDLGDFALPKKNLSVCEKPYKDQLSDLKQGKLTLPVYFLIKRSGINKEELVRFPPEKIIKLLDSTKTFEDCLDYLKKQHKKAKKELYKNFEKSMSRDLLATALAGISSNKFITSIKNEIQKQRKNYFSK